MEPVRDRPRRDRDQWQEMSGEDRGLVHWALSSLMVAEERITTKFAGLVLAYGSEEEATFLATQQVDEARHMQFYARFQDEVSPTRPPSPSTSRTPASSSPPRSPPSSTRPRPAHERLVANPADPAAKVAFVTTYHLVIESTLGLTAFRFITRYLESEGLLPGFVEGYTDPPRRATPHRLRRLVPARRRRSRPRARRRAPRDTRPLLPAVAESLTPPDRDGTDWDALGASSQEIREFALGGLNRRLGIIGVPL